MKLTIDRNRVFRQFTEGDFRAIRSLCKLGEQLESMLGLDIEAKYRVYNEKGHRVHCTLDVPEIMHGFATLASGDETCVSVELMRIRRNPQKLVGQINHAASSFVRGKKARYGEILETLGRVMIEDALRKTPEAE